MICWFAFFHILLYTVSKVNPDNFTTLDLSFFFRCKLATRKLGANVGQSVFNQSSRNFIGDTYSINLLQNKPDSETENRVENGLNAAINQHFPLFKQYLLSYKRHFL